MISLSISYEVSRLPAAENKRYDVLYPEAGYEFGFGRAGSYPAHSHRHFVDLIFSPGGIRWESDGTPSEAPLLIVPPGGLVPDLTTDEFAFLKFCVDRRSVILPDKCDYSGNTDTARVFRGQASESFPWFPRPSTEASLIRVSLDDRVLVLDFVGIKVLRVTN